MLVVNEDRLTANRMAAKAERLFKNGLAIVVQERLEKLRLVIFPDSMSLDACRNEMVGMGRSGDLGLRIHFSRSFWYKRI